MSIDKPEPREPAIHDPKVYDVLKFIALVGLPGVGSVYFVIAELFDLAPIRAEGVLGVILFIEGFLGLVLFVSSTKYKNSDARFSGSINVSETETKLVYSLELNHDPEELKEKDEAIFRIQSQPSSESHRE
jgi:hypothetical protein